MTSILIVNHEPSVAHQLQQYLEGSNQKLAAKAVRNGRQALYELRKQHYDLMITDFNMPKTDGIDLLRQSKRISPHILAILLTEYSTSQVQQMTRQLPIFRALTKPISETQLVTCVEDALQTHLDQAQDLTKTLEALRVDLGATATILSQNSGSVLAYTGSTKNLNLDATMALLGGAVSASMTVSQQAKQTARSNFSFFAGPPHDLYVSSVGDNHFLTIVSESNNQSRIGLVWHYTQTAVTALHHTLQQQEQTQPLMVEGFAKSVQNQLDDLLGLESNKAPTNLFSSGLKDKLNVTLQRFEKQTNIKVESHLDTLPQNLPAHLSKLILGFVGESLKNAYQHAQASIIGLTFYCEEGQLIGRIVDNGVGFVEEPTFKGLTPFIDKLEKQGGYASLKGKPEQGTTFTFFLPF